MVFSSVSVKLRAGRLSRLLDFFDRFVDLFDRHLHVARDRLVIVLLQVVEVLLDDLHFHFFAAVHVGLHAQTFAKITRASSARIPLHHDAVNFFGVLRTRGRPRAPYPRASNPACACHLPAPCPSNPKSRCRPSCRAPAPRNAAHRLGEITHLKLPLQMVDQAFALR